MDGTLVDSRAAVERSWRNWAAPRGLNADAVLRIAHGRRTRETLAEILPPSEVEAAVAELDAAELIDTGGVSGVPGAVPLLESLSPDAWAVVTSAGRELAEIRLRAAGMPAVPVLITSEDVGQGKPSPEGYHLAARRLGVEASACVVFEDAPPGIAAGIAAGAKVVALSTTQPLVRLTGSTVIIADLQMVRATRAGPHWQVIIG